MSAVRDDKLERYWDAQVATYDRQMRFMDRVVFQDTRRWVCSRAAGETLEVAMGTGLNLRYYPGQIRLTGLDLSAELQQIARARATDLDRQVTLVHGNAHTLPFGDATFDTVVCTFGLCSIPDVQTAISEMWRVLRPGGRLLLADHIISSSRVLRALQWLVERFTIPMAEEHFRRRPLLLLLAAGFEVDIVERFKLGVVERLIAHKPADTTGGRVSLN